MYFKYSCEIAGLRDFVKDSGNIEFRYTSPIEAVLQISGKYSNGQEPTDQFSAVCEGWTSGEINDTTVLAELNAALSSSVDKKWANFQEIDASRIPVIYGAVDPLFKQLRDLANSTIAVFRWRSGLPEGVNGPFPRWREYLSLDAELWLEISTVRSFHFVMGLARPAKASAQIGNQVTELVSSGTEEALGRQLFREAWYQRVAHPRSALVIGVAAAEVGLKKLIGTLVPQAQWLVEEIQTPSFSKISRKYLPSLPVRAKLTGKKLSPPNILLNSLEKAVECRNKVAHAGAAPPEREDLETMLRAVNDFLWICDLYVGHGWAAEYISHQTRTAWQNEL
jgi:hypothetical protein